MLDGATRVKDMVGKAVKLGMPAVAITDHGFMYGVPELATETDRVNHAEPDWQQWFHDLDNLEHGREQSELDPENPRSHAQWELDQAQIAKGAPLADVKPQPRIKPIYGCEIYFTPDETLSREGRPELYHLILLAKNQRGYVNLMKIVSDAAVHGFYYKPRVTLSVLRAHAEGLVCTSACVQGIVAKRIREDNPEDALLWAETLRDLFAPGDFYIEIQEHGLTYHRDANPKTDRQISEQLVAIAKKIGCKVVCTNDFHYLNREDALAEDILACIGSGKSLSDTQRFHMQRTESGEGEFYMKSEEEMRALFSWIPEAADTTLEIAEKCNVEFEWGNILLPQFPLDEGETNESQLRRDCEIGLAKRYGADWKTARPDVVERFEHEYEIICGKGFAAYFLIVADYVGWAKRNGIGVGPGRGSAGGSIVAYALDIITFDPLENGLLFERFLSPERTEMPDIDMDFDDDRRLEVIDYVRRRYGSDHVAHVITYGTIKARQAIRDAARVLDKPIPLANKLTKMINGLDPKLKDVLTRNSEHPEAFSSDFAKMYQTDPDAREVIDAALSIEGFLRNEGVHACAVLIAPEAVNEHVPTKLDTKQAVEITQYEGHAIADMGLLKMDFLGLRTLTVISKTLHNIKANYGIDVDIDHIPFDDPAIFELLSSGKTAGVFQVESEGMTSTIKAMRPSEFKHVVAIIALYRPGPLRAGMVDSYIARMNGAEPVAFYDERLSQILDETYGTIVYQEQVMQISMAMSGFSAGESDRVRKAVAKKKIKLMTEAVQHWEDGTDETMEQHWKEGAVRNGYDRKVAERIWDDVLEFASYAFNKSHSAGYAILVMQTAWLKAHYPKEFMAAVLTSYIGKTDKIVHYMNACRREGIAVLPPDVNESGSDFTATSEGVRFGLAGIKNLGSAVAEAIIAEREARGPYENLHDLVDRVPSQNLNRGAIECLVKAGSFDFSGYPRRQLMSFVDKNNPANVLALAQNRQKSRAEGQTSFFDLFDLGDEAGFELEVPPPSDLEWDRLTKLAQEKEALGLYVSDHPLSPFAYAMAEARDYAIADVLAEPDTSGRYLVPEDTPIWLCGMVSELTHKTTKRGEAMATLTLQDLEGELDVVVFPKVFGPARQILEDETNEVFVRIRGVLERTERQNQTNIQFKASEIQPLVLNEATNRQKTLTLEVKKEQLTPFVMEQLHGLFSHYPGNDRVELFVAGRGASTLRIAVPVQVDAKNMLLVGEANEVVGPQGSVKVA